MTRKEFLKFCALLTTTTVLAKGEKSKNIMPSLFISHGSPMNIIENNSYTRALKKIATTFDKPKAIVVISAHWYANNTYVSDLKEQETIYDFYGFPDELYDVEYEPSGNPSLAKNVAKLLKKVNMRERGLDHGAWSVLHHMYPNHDIPTFQISINKNLNYLEHFKLGSLLSRLRKEGVLIIGSGGAVHNLRLTRVGSLSIDKWALDFDSFVKDTFNKKEFTKLINAKKHPLFDISHPFDDHFIPMLYTAGLVKKNDKIEHFYEDIVERNLSMRCIKVG